LRPECRFSNLIHDSEPEFINLIPRSAERHLEVAIMPAAPATAPRPRERARDARRAALLECAEQVFAERGFAGATMTEIAARAGYSAGNLYNVFESKEELYREVMLASGQRVTEVLIGALERTGSCIERLDGLIDAFLGFGENHRSFFVILSQLTGYFEWGSAATNGQGEAIRNRIEHEMQRFCVQGIADGTFAEGDPRVYLNIITGAISAHVADWIRRDGKPGDLWGSAGQLRAAMHRALGVKS
jgi:AcrR family transcriptional regulator